MGRFVWSQLRHRFGRTAALLLGIVVATTSFTVLTATSRTSQLRTTATVGEHFRVAFDILVRPKGSQSAVEATTGTVEPNYLSGISAAQWHAVQAVPGVDVAAPIAMVGTAQPKVYPPVPVAPYLTSSPRQLFRVRTSWRSDRGLSNISEPDSFVYVTTNSFESRTGKPLALTNVLRTPGRSVLAALSLAVGAAALTLLVGITLTFRGLVVGSLLGDAVAVQVRGVDYIAVVATVALGVLAVADVLFLNLRERAGELATLRATGWTETALARLVVTEGALLGLVGALVGAAVGLAGAAAFAGALPGRLLLIGLLVLAGGTVVTALAALVPAQLLRRLPTAPLLAED